MTFKINTSSSLMDNHISASVLDADNGIAAIRTAANVEVLLSIGSDGILRSSIPSTKGKDTKWSTAQSIDTGWSTVDLSADLPKRYPGCASAKVSVVRIAQNSKSGYTGLLINAKITDTNGGFRNELLHVTGQDKDPSIWLADPTKLVWTSLTYDATSDDLSFPASVTPGNLAIDNLFHEAGLTDNDAPTTIALIRDPNGKNIVYPFIVDASAEEGGRWTYFPQGQDIDADKPLQIAIGRIDEYDDGWGIFKLYSASGEPTLTFRDYGDSSETKIELGGVKPTAIASLARVVDSNGPVTVTDLFYADDKGNIRLVCYNADKSVLAAPLFTNEKLFAGVTVLHVVAADDAVVLWGLNASKQVFYTRAPIDGMSDGKKWSTPLPMYRDIKALTPLLGAPKNQIGLYVLAGKECTAGRRLRASRDTIPVRLARNSLGHWISHPMPVPATNDYISFQSYTTRIYITDDRGLAASQLDVDLEVSSGCSLLINGAFQAISPGDRVPLKTDIAGFINIVHNPNALATPSITITPRGDDKAAIDPASVTREKLQKITADNIGNQTYTDRQGQQQKLVDPTVDADKMKRVGDAVGKIAQIKPAASMQAQNELGSFWDDLGDIANAIVHGLEDELEYTFEFLENESKFIITIGDAVFNCIVKTVEDIAHAVTSVIMSIVDDIEKLYEFLAYLFQWETFIAVKQFLYDACDQMMKSSVQSADSLKVKVDNALDKVRQDIDQQLTWLNGSAKTDIGNGGLNDHVAKQSQKSITHQATINQHPMMSWTSDRQQSFGAVANKKNTELWSFAQQGQLKVSGDVGDDLNNLLDKFDTLFKDIFTDFSELLAQLVDGSKPAGDVFVEFGIKTLKILADDGIDIIKGIIDLVLDSLEAFVDSIGKLLETKIPIPVLSALYHDITDNDLSLLDAACLLASIPLTIAYEVFEGGNIKQDIASLDIKAAIQSIFGQTAVSSELRSSNELMIIFGNMGGMIADIIEIGVAFGELEPEAPCIAWFSIFSNTFEGVGSLVALCGEGAFDKNEIEYLDQVEITGAVCTLIATVLYAYTLSKPNSTKDGELLALHTIECLTEFSLGCCKLGNIISNNKCTEPGMWGSICSGIGGMLSPVQFGLNTGKVQPAGGIATATHIGLNFASQLAPMITKHDPKAR